MQGLWGVYTQTLDLGLARPVIDLIVCLITFWFWVAFWSIRKRTWWEFRVFSGGLTLLIV
jgi:hypothetical protein